jgi:hypothetical protein
MQRQQGTPEAFTIFDCKTMTPGKDSVNPRKGS